MTARLSWYTYGIWIILTFVGQRSGGWVCAEPTADADAAVEQENGLVRPLMRLERGSALSEVAAMTETLDLLESEEDSAVDLREIHRHQNPAYPGAPSQTSVSDIKGQMEMSCKDPSKIFLSVPALNTVQVEIARVANVANESITTYFQEPSLLEDAKRPSALGEVHARTEKARGDQTKYLDVTFYISVPNGTDPDTIRKKVLNANKQEMTTNLGTAFFGLELIPSATEVTVTQFWAHEEGQTLVGPKAHRNAAAERACSVLLSALCVFAWLLRPVHSSW